MNVHFALQQSKKAVDRLKEELQTANHENMLLRKRIERNEIELEYLWLQNKELKNNGNTIQEEG